MNGLYSYAVIILVFDNLQRKFMVTTSVLGRLIAHDHERGSVRDYPSVRDCPMYSVRDYHSVRDYPMPCMASVKDYPSVRDCPMYRVRDYPSVPWPV